MLNEIENAQNSPDFVEWERWAQAKLELQHDLLTSTFIVDNKYLAVQIKRVGGNIVIAAACKISDIRIRRVFNQPLSSGIDDVAITKTFGKAANFIPIVTKPNVEVFQELSTEQQAATRAFLETQFGSFITGKFENNIQKFEALYNKLIPSSL